MLILVFLCGLMVAAVVAIYLVHHYSYWRRHGVPELRPTIPFGNMLPALRGKKSPGNTIASLYNETSEPFVGIYVLFQPQLLVRDLALVKHILQDNFDYFYNRNIHINECNDPLSVNLFSQRGDKWRALRHKLTPIFTAAKLRAMFPTFMTEVTKVDAHLEASAEKGETVILNKFAFGYVLNVIASVLYGLDVDILVEPNHVFKQMYSFAMESERVIDIARQSMVWHLPA